MGPLVSLCREWKLGLGDGGLDVARSLVSGDAGLEADSSPSLCAGPADGSGVGGASGVTGLVAVPGKISL